MFLFEIDSTNEHNKFVDEWSAHGQSDINLEHKSQVVADTRINRLIRTTHIVIGGSFFIYSNLEYKL
ncbi:MAG: hypothetical protein GX252_02395 [Enterococcus cecorum]|nr:hypothetical protein [Enterococcus cecorum]